MSFNAKWTKNPPPLPDTGNLTIVVGPDDSLPVVLGAARRMGRTVLATERTGPASFKVVLSPGMDTFDRKAGKDETTATFTLGKTLL